ncbi:MAG: DUF58 domain-containing protein [Gammaproteobacteria bacterium]|jgi:uncharacterized protein (DUF58 family)|nr:DUF58 domain-containing protein [Gammaproteobacteria bacterium]
MAVKSRLDPQHERYQSRGALISLAQLLIQRQAAKTLAYLSQARSIAGISGLHLSKIRGRGIDFEEFRPYQAGDDIRLIDWRATARTGRAVTKVFREERERPVIIAVDQCASMYFGSQVAFKSVIAAQAAALFCWLAVDNGDRVGGLVFSDTQSSLVRPKRSRRSALHLLNQVFTFNNKLKDRAPQEPQEDFEPGLAHALGQIRRISKPGSTLYVISDFATLDGKALQYLNQLSRHNNVICCMVYDALEESLPIPGVYSITDGSSKGSINTHSGKARAKYKAQFEERVAGIEGELERLKIRLIKLRTNQLVVEQVREWIAKNS